MINTKPVHGVFAVECHENTENNTFVCQLFDKNNKSIDTYREIQHFNINPENASIISYKKKGFNTKFRFSDKVSCHLEIGTEIKNLVCK